MVKRTMGHVGEFSASDIGAGTAETAATPAVHLGVERGRKPRLSIIFAASAVVAIALAALIVNLVIGGLAEDNLIRLTEENSLREGSHVQSLAMTMIEQLALQQVAQGLAGEPSDTQGGTLELPGGLLQGGPPTPEALAAMGIPDYIANLFAEGQPSPEALAAAGIPDSIADLILGGPPSPEALASAGVPNSVAKLLLAGQPSPEVLASEGLTADSMPPIGSMDWLASPFGLPTIYRSLTQGLNMEKLSLYDLNGKTLWSTDPNSIGMVNPELSLFDQAAENGISSRFVRDKELMNFSGANQRLDVMEIYMPIRQGGAGELMGWIEADRNVTGDVAIQVDDAKKVVFWTTVSTMGGLFLILFGFIVVADLSIDRSHRRELSLVNVQLSERQRAEEAVRQANFKLEQLNQTLEDRVQQRTSELEEANQRLVEAQDQLVRTERLAALGQMAGGVAHDLRNPLTSIRGAVSFLTHKLNAGGHIGADSDVGEFLEIIDGEVTRSDRIIGDLMDFARVGPSNQTTADVVEVIDSAISTMDLGDNVRLIKNLEPGLPAVVVDGEQLRRVIFNLVNNAQDAMPEGGTITITATGNGDCAVLDVTDTGIGIPEEDVQRIFDPLFTSKAKGTGLGLSVCHKILDQINGSIDVRSQVGKGTSFIVRIPFAATAQPEGEGAVLAA